MGGLYLTWLADELRGAGLNVVEYQGWQTRARSSGGYDANPLCVMWHHTASNTTPANDANFMCNGSSDRPIANLLIARNGEVWVLAAGATNTNGKGGPLSFSRGQVPLDSMNTRALGCEIANTGTGEQYPQAQVDAMFVVSNVCNRRFGNQPADVASHNLWAPTRKIDPATTNVAGPWQPRSSTSSGTWSTDDIRGECSSRAGSGPTPIPPDPTPTPPDDEDEMDFDGFWRRDNSEAVYAIFKHGGKQWMTDQGYLNAMRDLWAIRGATGAALTTRVQSDPALFAAFGLVEGPREPGTDEWGNKV
ncbi:MAG: N-acetylmuramoyl-L-alanine amidase family 2 [Desertimonas sp.]|nr:N-acetylmuramoyl-L-alanine amidase family 2 [Desertimonas sp.]